jgi:hypothetical protein
MAKKDLRTDVESWAQEIGERAAQARLINERVSPNTAQKLTSGKYPNKPGRLMEGAILRAMGRPEEQAS